MIVAEVLCQHLLYGCSVIVSVDDDKLEGRTHDVDDIVDEIINKYTKTKER